MASAYIGFAHGKASGDELLDQLIATTSALQANAMKIGDLLSGSGLTVAIDEKRNISKAEIIEDIVDIRRFRDSVFQEDFFIDPAWNMLIGLYRRQLSGRRTMVSDACAATGAPSTTGLRWLRVLEERGWVVREPDTTDGRRVFIKLTEKATEKMDKICEYAIKKALRSR